MASILITGASGFIGGHVACARPISPIIIMQSTELTTTTHADG